MGPNRVKLYFSVMLAGGLVTAGCGKTSGKAEETSTRPATAVAPAAAASAPTPAAKPAPVVTVGAAGAPAVVRADYATEGLRKIAADCTSSKVILTAVTREVFEGEHFIWRFARQVAVANPELKYVGALTPDPGRILFYAAEHLPTKGVALVAECSDAKSCIRFAAAYKTVVPTSKPEIVCGEATRIGPRVPGPAVVDVDNADPLSVSLPAKGDTVSQCVRLAACRAARDKQLPGDPAVECQAKPSQFSIDCAKQASCAQVLSCAGL